MCYNVLLNLLDEMPLYLMQNFFYLSFDSESYEFRDVPSRWHH